MSLTNRLIFLVWLGYFSCSFAQSPAGKTDFNVADRLAIQNVISSHFLNLDSNQNDAWIANYADKATFIAVVSGKRYESERPIFEEFFRERFRKFEDNGDQRRHLVSNILFVDQSEDTAHIKANGLLLTTNNGVNPELVGGLTYEGWFVKRKGVWKISKWKVCGDTNIEVEGTEKMDVSEDKGIAIASTKSGVKTFVSNGVKIAFYDQGRGEPVVVLHGFAADAEFMKGLSDSLLEAGYRVITIDQRGHGQSGKPHEPNAYGEEMADDVVRLLEHLKLPKAHVVGYSMGGCIANNLRDRHPDRLCTVTIAGAGMSVTDWGMPGVTPQKLATSLRNEEGIKLLLRALGATDPDFDSEAKIEDFNESFMYGKDPLALAALLDAQPGLQVPMERLKANSVPTLVVVGDSDGNIKGAKQLAAVMKQTKLVVIKKTSHIQMLQRPKFVGAVVQFLQDWQATMAKRN